MKITTEKDNLIEKMNASFKVKRYTGKYSLCRKIELITWNRRSSFYAVIEKSSSYWVDGYKVYIMQHGLIRQTMNTASYSYAKDIAESMLLRNQYYHCD